MISRYVWRDLVRNPRRSLSALAGITLGVGLFSAVLFFIDGSSASMTARAIAPLPIDIQRVLADPLGHQVRLTEQFRPARLEAGGVAEVTLVLANRSSRPANEVVIRDQPPPPLTYVAGSTTIDGEAFPDPGGDSPFAQGEAELGLNLGTVPARTQVIVAYRVRAGSAVASVPALGSGATFSSREVPAPAAANASEPLTPDQLTDRIAAIPGVAHADRLAMVDLAPGSLRSGSRQLSDPVRVFGFDDSYRLRDPAIRIVAGSQQPGQGLVSAEAARTLGVRIGDSVQLRVPGATAPLVVPISGTTDLTGARSLFYSRSARELEQFVYVRNSVVVSSEVFDTSIVTAFRNAATTTGRTVRSLPLLEVDVALQREPLDADPGTALLETTAVSRAVAEIAPGPDELIDNVSNTLSVARDDARVAKRMFFFLGLPGAILAAILTSYAGGVLAGALRREQAILRIRGADRRLLLAMHAVRSLILAAVGSSLGVALGLLSAVAVLSADDVGRASTASLLSSAGISAGCGFVATAVALYAAGLGAIRRQIHDERAQLASRRPWWRRVWLDLLILVPLAFLVRQAERSGAFEGVGGSVYYGRSVSLRLQLVVIPLAVWVGSVLLFARLVGLLLPRVPLPRHRRFGGPWRGLLTRSVRRRSWSVVGAVIMLGLIVALGTSIACFSASYDRAKSADSRYVVGSDLRITPAPTSTRAHPPGYSHALQVAGVERATPVVFGLSNALVESETNEDAANLAAVDPAAYARVAPTADGNFVGQSATAALAALEQHPTGVFVGSELADLLDVEQGDDVSVLLARGSKQQKLTEMQVLGLFERLPGFPEGANLLVNLERHVQLVPATNATFFLARTTDADPGTLHQAMAALAAGPGSTDALQLESRETALDKDQSSLAALNIRGLLTLDSAYALAMAATAVGVYVFGLLLQRRREYVTLRAQGVRTGLVRSLLVSEAVGVAVLGAGPGVVVGMVMATFLVRVLRPLFILTPAVIVPAGQIALLAGLVLVVSVLASLAATRLVNRLSATELLRDE